MRARVRDAHAGAADDAVTAYERRGINLERAAAVERVAGSTVLDVGCASGGYLDRLRAGGLAVGLDATQFAAWGSSNATFIRGDARKLPVADGSFETVLLFETLEHLPDAEEALREYHRVCTRNLIVTVPNCSITTGMRSSGLIYNHWIDRSHVNFYDLDALTESVVRAGFAVREARLINRLDVFALFGEAFRLPAPLVRVLRRLLRGWARPYYMTCLVVADR